MRLTKTTFELDPGLLTQLKATAAHAGTSVRVLLTEGARTVIEKYQALGDREELRRRARETRRKLREGYFSGDSGMSANIDRLVYGVAERPPDYSAGTRRKRRRE